MTASNRPRSGTAYRWPKQKDSNPLKVDPCTGKPLDPEQFEGRE
jgi:hypothetical protein